MPWIQPVLKILPWVIEGGRVVVGAVGDKKKGEIERLKNEIQQKDEIIRVITGKTKIYFSLFIVSLCVNATLIFWVLRR